MKLKDALNGIKNKELEIEKIEMILDKFGTDDRLIEAIKTYHTNRFSSTSFVRVVDIIESLDLTAIDESYLASKIDEMSMKNFYTLLINMKLSRPELVFFIKNGIAQDDEIIKAFGVMKLPDLIEITARWRPKLFKGPLAQYIVSYSIPQNKIDKYLARCQLDQKFKFLM